MTEILSKSLEETEKAAKVFIEKLLPSKNQATVVALSGDLGSGKTTFVQVVARSLGIKENITSPTFVIIKTYNLQLTTYNKLIHIDAYRLKDGEELRKLGSDEMIADPKNLIFIEWPENVADAIPKDAIKISFEFIDEKTRKIIL
jgi:tRNA threonylcarbamoyladenosine biosynthesis protein TsaE